MFESWFAKREINVIDWRSAADTAKIPDGFFRVLMPGGKKTRGLKHPSFGLYWTTPDEALLKLGLVLPTADELAQRPIVRRTAAAAPARDGVMQLPNGSKALTTDSLDAFDGNVKYDGTNAGYKETDDPRAALDGGLWGGGY